jgi:hypothetical protein
MLNMDHDVDFVMMYQMLMVDVNLLDELKMLNNVQWNVDDDNQYNNDDNLLMVDEMYHQHLIVVAKKNLKKKLIKFDLKFK